MPSMTKFVQIFWLIPIIALVTGCASIDLDYPPATFSFTLTRRIQRFIFLLVAPYLQHAESCILRTCDPSACGHHFPAVATPPTDEQRLERLAERLDAARIEQHVPGLAVAVVKDDKVIFARGFGLANIAEGIPVTPETIFAIGSTTKSFTASTIGMLVDEGLMNWDDPVSKWLPYFMPSLNGADDGPILLVEGGSDTAALMDMGLAVIGRPGNIVPKKLFPELVKLLAELLADNEREIIVIGENDEKPDGRWPGREGAISTATRLAEALDRTVACASASPSPCGGKRRNRDAHGVQVNL